MRYFFPSLYESKTLFFVEKLCKLLLQRYRYLPIFQYYDAIVTGVKPGVNTIVVRFLEYGNHEEVLKEETIPVTNVC